MAERDKAGSQVGTPKSQTPASIPLSPTTTMDLSWMPEDQRGVLLAEYAKGMLDISRKAQELHVDVATLKNTLDQLATTTREVSEAGNSVTVTHTQTTKIGRTEVSMGNTAAAQSGRLSSTQTGSFNWTPIYIFAGIVAAIVIAAVVVGR